MKNTKFYIFSLYICIIALSACKPETDTCYPLVSVLQPQKGQFFNNGDTIRLQAEISDDENLAYVTVDLVNENNQPMLPTMTLYPNCKNYILNGELPISDPFLPAGVYQMRFRASDGKNVTNQFVEVRVSELARELLYPIVVTKLNSTVSVIQLQGDKLKTIFTYQGDYAGSAVNCKRSQAVICGKWQSNLVCFHLPDGEILWQIPADPNSVNRWVENLSFSDDITYTTHFKGFTSGHDHSGYETYRSDMFGITYPDLSVRTENFIVTSNHNASGTQHYLVTCHNEGGLFLNSKMDNSIEKALICTDKDNVLAFGNTDFTGTIQLFKADEVKLLTERVLAGLKIHSAIGISKDKFLLSTSDGLWIYTQSSAEIIQFSKECSYSRLAFDDISQEIYATNGNYIFVFNYPWGTFQRTYSLPGSVMNIHLVYNK